MYQALSIIYYSPAMADIWVLIKLTSLVCVERTVYGLHILLSLSKDQRCQSGEGSVSGFAFIFAVSIGQALSFLWASDFSSVKNVMLTRIDDIYIPSSLNIVRS